MAEIFQNFAMTTLAAPFPIGAAVIVATSNSMFDALPTGAPIGELRVVLEGPDGLGGIAREIVKIVGRGIDGQSLFLSDPNQRGLEGTTPRDWPAGTKVFAALTAGSLAAVSAGPMFGRLVVNASDIVDDPSQGKAKWFKVTVGGAGGGGAYYSGSYYAGGGGGETAFGIFDANELSWPIEVTIGAGGAGLGAVGTAGAGGSSAFGAHIMALGGAGATAGNSSSSNGIGGGNTSGNAKSGAETGIAPNKWKIAGGNGGTQSTTGHSGSGVAAGGSNGGGGGGYGGGGSSAVTNANTNVGVNGGGGGTRSSGGGGICIIEWFA
jgi:hypothetical protein